MSQGVRVRGFSTDDIAAVSDLLRRLGGARLPVEPLEPSHLTELLARPAHAGGRDFRVAEASGELVGALFAARYTLAERPLPVREVRLFAPRGDAGEAARSALLDAALALDPDRVFRRAQDPGGELTQTLAARGFSPAQSVWVMTRRGVPPVVSPLPEGMRLRDAALPADTPALLSLVASAHRAAFGFGPMEAADLEALLRPPGARVLVVERDRTPVGFVSTLPTREALGVLNLLQVAPEVQGAGVGRVLAEAALHALAQQGFAQVQVHVDAANVVACALYTSVGFVTTRIDVVHERGP